MKPSEIAALRVLILREIKECSGLDVFEIEDRLEHALYAQEQAERDEEDDTAEAST